MTGCMVSLSDLADREPRPLADGETLDIGGHRLRWIDTPHVPHAWEAGLLFDETTRTLFCGDLFTHMGNYPATDHRRHRRTGDRGRGQRPRSLSLHPASGSIIRRLADLTWPPWRPCTVPAFTGDCTTALIDIADDIDKRIAAAG